MVYPPEVQSYRDRVVEQTGIDPDIEETRFGWKLTVSSDRVCNTAFFRRSPGNRVYISGVKLTVDGVVRPPMRSDEEFGNLWSDPDYRQTLSGEFPPPADPTDVPPALQAIVRKLRPVLGDHLRIGFGNGRWVLGVESPRVELRVIARRLRGRVWGIRRVLLVVDGVDRSDEVDDQLDRALSMMAGVDLDTPEVSTGSANTSTPRARSNSVEVRNTVVMRN